MRKSMPKKNHIWDYWKGKFSDDGEMCCFACERTTNLERCHIIPNAAGGDESLSNLHLLCASCHKQTEGMGYYNPSLYYLFLKNKESWTTEITRIIMKEFKY